MDTHLFKSTSSTSANNGVFSFQFSALVLHRIIVNWLKKQSRTIELRGFVTLSPSVNRPASFILLCIKYASCGICAAISGGPGVSF